MTIAKTRAVLSTNVCMTEVGGVVLPADVGKNRLNGTSLPPLPPPHSQLDREILLSTEEWS
jgi:hypothetical protein